MSASYNIYCDESCHMEHDGATALVMGAVWCGHEHVHGIAEAIRDIKRRHGLASDLEVKWTKVSPAKQQFYADLVEYFLGEPELHFRAVVVPDKAKLQHDAFQQDHDTWYYKMYFLLLKEVFLPDGSYEIYLDIKDTRSQAKVETLRTVLRNNLRASSRVDVTRIQQVRSHEIEQVQLADLLVGAVSYDNRGLTGSAAKLAVIRQLLKGAGHSLRVNTPRAENKVNLLIWGATEGGHP